MPTKTPPKTINAERPDTTARVTLEHVALQAGLGRTTVSDILNRGGAGKYSEETRSRVRMAVKQLGYAPSRAAQQLARGKSGLIGLMLLRDFSNPYWARVADAVEKELRQRDYRLQLAITDNDPASEKRHIMDMQSDGVEALLVGPVYEHQDFAQHESFFQGRLPIVLFGHALGSQFDEVHLDTDGGLTSAIDHLMEHGHQKIGFLCAPPSRFRDAPTNEDYPGYRLFRDRGMYDPQWFTWQTDTGRFEDFFAACAGFADRWLAAAPARRPTAVMCHNDQVAMTALSAFASRGIRVPDDLSMIGFDNLPESAYLVPPLTTVDNRIDKQMNAAVELIVARTAAPKAPPTHHAVKPELIVRDSVRAI